jgi:hypothetical protein
MEKMASCNLGFTCDVEGVEKLEAFISDTAAMQKAGVAPWLANVLQSPPFQLVLARALITKSEERA